MHRRYDKDNSDNIKGGSDAVAITVKVQEL